MEGDVETLKRIYDRFNARDISPGLIDTPPHDRIAREALYEWMEQQVPILNMERAEDEARATLLAATNPFVTDAIVIVVGGGSIM